MNSKNIIGICVNINNKNRREKYLYGVDNYDLNIYEWCNAHCHSKINKTSSDEEDIIWIFINISCYLENVVSRNRINSYLFESKRIHYAIYRSYTNGIQDYYAICSNCNKIMENTMICENCNEKCGIIANKFKIISTKK